MPPAYNTDQIGAAEKTAVIKAPVVAELNSPRYLSQDDDGVFSLSLHNTTDRAQRLRLDLRSEGLTLADTPTLPETLAPKQNITLRYPYRAGKAGDAHIKASISGDYSETLERRIPVRAPTLPQIRSQYQRLDSGATLELSGLNAAHLNLDQGLPNNAHRFGEQLAAYPYWCNEQTTSKLWGRLSQKKTDLKALHDLERTLAISAHYDGSYTLWWSGKKDRWLTAYAGEALTQMRHNKQLKNPEALGRTLTYLRNNSNGDYNSDHAHADSYAYYTLAYAGESVRGLVLRYHHQAGNQLNRADSLDIAAALALLGEYQAASGRLADTAGKGRRAGRGGIAFQLKYDTLHLFNIRSNIVSDFTVAPRYRTDKPPFFVLQLHTGAIQFVLYQKIGERHLFCPFLETFGIRCFFLTPHRDNVFRLREAVGAVLGYRCK